MKHSPKKEQTGNKNQGEGDRESAARYNEAARKFVKSGRVEEAVERAGGQDTEEAERSEEAGRRRSKEVDPAVHRDYRKPTK
jgi:hypothetical protein